MNKINYQRVLDQTIEEITKQGITPTLLLHSCCAPCSSYVLEYLSRYFTIADFYYNPNIYPEEEYDHRVHELESFVDRFPAEHPIRVIPGEYHPKEFYEAARGLEQEPEGGARCEACFRLRLEASARKAVELGCEYFTTTLSISPMKDAQLLNALGGEIGTKYGVKYLYSDFKKRGGYQRSTELSRIYGLYRQDYCGCVFSLRERQAQKAAKAAKEEPDPSTLYVR